MLSSPPANLAGVMRLIDTRTRDGSRQFLCLPQSVDWAALRSHVEGLPKAQVVNFVGSRLATARLDFLFYGHRFHIGCRDGQFHFCVRNPHCSDLIVYRVAQYFGELLDGQTQNIPQTNT
jgi:hypothetical protein